MPESTVPRRVFIAPSCRHSDARPLPDSVCGVDRDLRLRKTLARRGLEVVDSEIGADEVIDPCRIYAKDRELSTCRDGLAAAETALLLALRKDIDGMVARHLNRKISGWVTRHLMNTAVEPNHVTLFTIALGVASGLVIALGGYWAGVAGAALLQTQSVLDGVDGELSRLKFQGSKLGEWLDTISDDISNLSFFAGATYVSAHGWVQITGVAGMILFVLLQASLYTVLATVYRSGNLQVFQWDVGAKDGLFARIEWMFKRDSFCMLFLILAVASALDVAVVIFAVGVAISALTFIRQVARGGVRR